MNKKYNFGENDNLVQEVLDFLKSGVLLKESSDLKLKDDELTDFKKAEKFAYYEVYGDEEYTWTDIRSDESSKIWGRIFEQKNKNEVEDQLDKILNEVINMVGEQLTKQYDELLDDIAEDLSMCIKSRAIQGTGNKFYEDIFKAYKSGGWPCGWKGNWPNDGELIVFYPKSQQRSSMQLN